MNAGLWIFTAFGVLMFLRATWLFGFASGKAYGVEIGERRGEDRTFARFMDAVDGGVWVPGPSRKEPK